MYLQFGKVWSILGTSNKKIKKNRLNFRFHEPVHTSPDFLSNVCLVQRDKTLGSWEVLLKEAATMIHQLIFTKLLGELDYGAGTGIGDFNAAGCASRSAPAEPRGSRGALERQKGTTSSAHTHPCRHQGPGAGRDACVRSRRWRRRRRRWL